MRISLAASLMFGTLLLTGCTDWTEKSKPTITVQTKNNSNYQLSNKFIMNHVEYKNLHQYKAKREQYISQEIEQYVEKEGYSEDGYDAEGYDRRGFNRNGINKEGFAEDGFNLHGINALGSARDASPSSYTTPYNSLGYDTKGYDIDGYNIYGYNAKGYSIDGFNKLGESENPDEVSMTEYTVRSWETIPNEEVFLQDLYYSIINQKMKNDANLVNQYYSQGKHPYSETAYYINLICNSAPAIFDDLYPVIRVETLDELKMKHPSHHNKSVILKSNDGEIIQVINDEKFVPERLLIQYKQIQLLKMNDMIQLENSEGVLTNFTVIKQGELSKEAQNYIDFARLALQEGKGKWADAAFQFDILFYEAMDQQSDDIELSEAILDELKEERQQLWPENYLTDSNEEIEHFNKEAREEFIFTIMQDIQIYEHSKHNK